MKGFLRTLVFGVLLWLVVFIGAMIVFPVKRSDPVFFETLMAIILSAATVAAGRIFFRAEDISLKKCIGTGLTWMIVNMAIDLPLFSFGPMKRPFVDYMTDIGLTYLIIPVILSAFASRK